MHRKCIGVQVMPMPFSSLWISREPSRCKNKLPLKLFVSDRELAIQRIRQPNRSFTVCQISFVQFETIRHQIDRWAHLARVAKTIQWTNDPYVRSSLVANTFAQIIVVEVSPCLSNSRINRIPRTCPWSTAKSASSRKAWNEDTR